MTAVRTLGNVVLMLAVIVGGGCRRKDPIARFKAPKEPTWRMLAALVPAADQTWFFKTVGPGRRLAEHKEEFVRLMKSVKFEGAEAKWTLPEGWKEEKAGGERVATLKFGKGEPPLELTVVRLPGTAGGVLANINRWRGQLGMQPLSEATLARETEMQEVGGVPSTLVDFEGLQKPPSMGGAMSGGVTTDPRKPQAPSPAALRELFAFELPAGWVENPQPQSGRYFEIRAGDATAYLNILQGDAGGIAGNVNRWRGQIGLDPVADEAAQRLAQPVSFLGAEGSSVELTGTEKAVVIAFKMGPPYSIFLKMDGPTDAVERQRRAFWEFVRTLKIKSHG